MQIRSGEPAAASKERGRMNANCTGFPHIQLLTNAEYSINPACSLFFLVFHLKKSCLRKNKDICCGRRDTAGSSESGNIDCKPGRLVKGPLTWTKCTPSTAPTNIYPRLSLFVKQYPSEELQLLSQHLFVVEPLTFCLQHNATIKF
jgi:hypothetical protein